MDGGIRMTEEKLVSVFSIILTNSPKRGNRRPGFQAQFTGEIAHPSSSFYLGSMAKL